MHGSDQDPLVRFEVQIRPHQETQHPTTSNPSQSQYSYSFPQWTRIILKVYPQPSDTPPTNNHILLPALIYLLHTLHQPLTPAFIATDFSPTYPYHTIALAKSNYVYVYLFAPPYSDAPPHTPYTAASFCHTYTAIISAIYANCPICTKTRPPCPYRSCANCLLNTPLHFHPYTTKWTYLQRDLPNYTYPELHCPPPGSPPQTQHKPTRKHHIVHQ